MKRHYVNIVYVITRFWEGRLRLPLWAWKESALLYAEILTPPRRMMRMETRQSHWNPVDGIEESRTIRQRKTKEDYGRDSSYLWLISRNRKSVIRRRLTASITLILWNVSDDVNKATFHQPRRNAKNAPDNLIFQRKIWKKFCKQVISILKAQIKVMSIRSIKYSQRHIWTNRKIVFSHQSMLVDNALKK